MSTERLELISFILTLLQLGGAMASLFIVIFCRIWGGVPSIWETIRNKK